MLEYINNFITSKRLRLPHKGFIVLRQDTPSVVLSFTPDADATLQMEAGPYDAANRIGVVPSAGDICLIQVSHKLLVCLTGVLLSRTTGVAGATLQRLCPLEQAFLPRAEIALKADILGLRRHLSKCMGGSPGTQMGRHNATCKGLKDMQEPSAVEIQGCLL